MANLGIGPYIALGDLPTPVIQLTHLGNAVGHHKIYMKRDDLTGAVVNGQRLFGGNKVRKLEILLADALRCNASEVLTVGCAGSNHALATVIYAKQLGLKSRIILAPQPNSSIVQRNLLLDQYYGAQIIPVQDRVERREQFAMLQRMQGTSLYAIPAGGSAPLGTVGYVNAVFELKKQIAQGLLPMPNVIYVALGSGGTVAGLLLGIRAAQLPITLRAIAVDSDDFPLVLKKLVPATNQLLHEADPSFPLFMWRDEDFAVATDFIGGGYGIVSPQADAAIEMLKNTEHVLLEGTYSAKAFAAVLHDIASGGLKDKTVLFWNTFSAGEFADLVKTVDYQTLPAALHKYFATAHAPGGI